MSKNPIRPAAKFVRRHKVAVTVVATTTVCVIIHRKTIKDLNAFLTEHNLFDTYYAMDEI